MSFYNQKRTIHALIVKFVSYTKPGNEAEATISLLFLIKDSYIS